ncbi:hypothetical protein ACFSC6_03085 [Rufibacter sediminis]|uniref:STAS/SEC14 domain-containing protein n=1 Tax=Rufibacter sediminis TaxID=2762756 RepID=A0ABR6VVF3_9BACT|nr:hypothetical protein [Rufibacter sediminis]MBC3541139.1 hypothetical protein [Rufibacter sediminis]
MHIDLQLRLVHQDDNIKVEVDENAKFIYLEWLQAPPTEEFRKAFHLAGMICLEYKCEYWLSEARPIPYLEFADQNWVLREMKPILIKSTLKKYARISSKESISLLDIHRIYSALNDEQDPNLKTHFESFTSKDAALDWLFSDFEQDKLSEEE